MILDTAAAMLAEMPVAQVSLNELSRRVGLAKSNVLRYFESREAVLLDLLGSEWQEWLAALAGELDDAVDPSAPVAALGWARGDRRAIFHADRGSTSAAGDFTKLSRKLGSASRWDVSGRASTTPPQRREHEVLSRHRFATKAQAREVVTAWC